MDLGLTGKVVLVTGASQGIGLACAEAFCAEGARVAIASRSPERLATAREALAARGHAVATFPADLVDPNAASALVEAVEVRLGPLDVLVNSAGAARRTAPEQLDAQAWHDAMNAKFFTYMHTTQAALPRMAARGRGTVVQIVGQGGKVANPNHLPGGSANAALMLATAGLAAAYGPLGIRVNAINPGLTVTERAQRIFEFEAARAGISVEEVRGRGEKLIPLGRYGRPEEVAAVAVFLASDRASYVTGAVVPMDGGSAATVV